MHMHPDQCKADRNVGDDMSFGRAVSPLKYPTRNFLTWGEVYAFQERLSTIINAGWGSGLGSL